MLSGSLLFGEAALVATMSSGANMNNVLPAIPTMRQAVHLLNPPAPVAQVPHAVLVAQLQTMRQRSATTRVLQPTCVGTTMAEPFLCVGAALAGLRGHYLLVAGLTKLLPAFLSVIPTAVQMMATSVSQPLMDACHSRRGRLNPLPPAVVASPPFALLSRIFPTWAFSTSMQAPECALAGRSAHISPSSALGLPSRRRSR